MERLKSILVTSLLFTAGVSLKAQLAPQPFLPPPRLPPKQVTGTVGIEALRAAVLQSCTPDGDITVAGNTVPVNLNVRYLPNTIRNPGDTNANSVIPSHIDEATLRSYGGRLTRPLIEVHPGNTLRVHLHNELDTTDPSCDGKDPGCSNTINLHFHGLHVSPIGVTP
jgi:FtsP/CotA-like multicopper oxidase with cupredoxin domain